TPQVGAAIEQGRGEEDHAGDSPAREDYSSPCRKAEGAALFRPTSCAARRSPCLLGSVRPNTPTPTLPRRGGGGRLDDRLGSRLYPSSFFAAALALAKSIWPA